jgi:hypothetical protein
MVVFVSGDYRRNDVGDGDGITADTITIFGHGVLDVNSA